MSLPRDTDTPKTWQQTKSENTRTAILDAAIECFYRLGYASTTTENIANAAGVSRGAMLHHFANRFELIRAAIEHLTAQRLDTYVREGTAVQQDPTQTRIDDGIDVYWRQLNTPAFIVFHELLVASRTDPELREAMIPAYEKFRDAAFESSRQMFPDLARSEAFLRANVLTQYLLEGMAIARITTKAPVPADLMLKWLKLTLKAEFSDVLPEHGNPADNPRHGHNRFCDDTP